jgi:pilus assembly protein CpaE
VTSADAVHVVVNRFVRRSEIQQDTVDMLTLGQRSQILIPDLDRALERSGNSRTPSEVKNQAWWKSLRAIGAELDLGSAFRDAVATAARMESADGTASTTSGAAPAGSSTAAVASGPPAKGHNRSAGRAAKPPRGRSARRVAMDSGQATLETVAMFPFALLILAICLQTILLGVSYAYSGVAADAAARAVSIGTNPQLAVAEALPAGLYSKVSVNAGGSSVRVTVRAPLLVGDGVTRDVGIVVNHRVVEEPR